MREMKDKYKALASLPGLCQVMSQLVYISHKVGEGVLHCFLATIVVVLL